MNNNNITQAHAKKNLSTAVWSFKLLFSQLPKLKIKQHDKNLNEWWNYCMSKNIDPFRIEITDVLEYFGKKMNDDKATPEDLKQIGQSIELLKQMNLLNFLCCQQDTSKKKINTAAKQVNSKSSLIAKGKKKHLSKISSKIMRKKKYSKENTLNNKLRVLVKNNSFKKVGNSKITRVDQQIKILILLSDNKTKVIHFPLMKNKKYNIHYIRDLLKAAGIPVNNKTKILFLTNAKSSYNIIVDCSVKTYDNNSTGVNDTIFNSSNNNSSVEDVSEDDSFTFETNYPYTDKNNLRNTNNIYSKIFKSFIKNDYSASIEENDTIYNLFNNSIEKNIPSTIDCNDSIKTNDTISNPTNELTNNSQMQKLALKIVDNPQELMIEQLLQISLDPNCTEEVLLLKLPYKKYHVSKILKKSRIIIDDETEVSRVIHKTLTNINYIVECDSTNLKIKSIKVNDSISKVSNELLIDDKFFKYSHEKITDLETSLFEPKIKILILMPDDDKKLITFDLPTKKCCINDLLVKAGIPINNNTKVSIVDSYSGLNYYYLVEHKGNEGSKIISLASE